MKKTSYILFIYFSGPFSRLLAANSLTVTIFHLYSGRFEIFTRFVRRSTFSRIVVLSPRTSKIGFCNVYQRFSMPRNIGFGFPGRFKTRQNLSLSIDRSCPTGTLLPNTCVVYIICRYTVSFFILLV